MKTYTSIPVIQKIQQFACLVCITSVPLLAQAQCPTPFIEGLVNSCEVVPQVLWRGGKPDIAAATQLVGRGVKTVVNLEMLHDDQVTFAATRPVLFKPAEIQYYTLPDWEPLALITPALLDKRVETFIAIARTAPQPLFVHCRTGQNRTGVMVAALRIFDGMPVEQAIADMASYGGLWAKQDSDYLRRLTPKKRAIMTKNIAIKMQRIKPDVVLTCQNNTGCTPALTP